MVPAPVYSWTGWYVGGNVGYGWGNARADIAGSGTSLLFPIAVPGFPGVPATLGFADSNTGRLDGVIGGAQLGYNYQFRPKWVVGFEADIQGSGQRGSGTFVTPLSAQLCTDLVVFPPPVGCDEFTTGNGTAATGYEAKIGWFGTVRGRLGFLITDQVLLYGTGGLAYGRVEVSGNTNAFISFPAHDFRAFRAANLHLAAMSAVALERTTERTNGIPNLPKVACRAWLSLRYAARKTRRGSRDFGDPPCRTDCGTAVSW